MRWLLLTALLAAPSAFAQDAPPLDRIPLAAGTMMVRVHETPGGDLEEIRVVQQVTKEGIRLSRSAQVAADGGVQSYSAPRFVANDDMRGGRAYAFSIVPGEPERQPGTTALGLSTLLFDELKANNHTVATFLFGREPVEGAINSYPQTEMVELIYNGERRVAPAIRTTGIFKLGDRSTTFATWYLADRSNPLSLKSETPVERGKTRTSLLAVVTTFSPQLRADIGAKLRAGKRVELYGFQFDLGQSALREESVFALKLLLAVLRDNPGLRLQIRVNVDAADNPSWAQERTMLLEQTLARELPDAADRVRWRAGGGTQPLLKGEGLFVRAANRRVTLQPL